MTFFRTLVVLLMTAGPLPVAGAAGDGTAPTADPGAATTFAERLDKARAGDAESQYLVGILMATGRGTTQDHEQAARWFLRAAEQNHLGAQLNLAALHTLGMGVPKDQFRAFVWYRIAMANNGGRLPPGWRERYENVAAAMTAAQRRRAETLADEWRSGH